MGRALPALWAKTAASVEHVAGALPDGWDLQWCIHIDGIDLGFVHAQPWWAVMRERISFSASDRSGFAGARNKALALAEGEVVGMCDDDDELAEGWCRLLHVLLQRECGWVAGATEDIDEFGVVLPSPPLVPGVIAPGAVNDMFLATGVWPWHGCAAIARTTLVRSVGGWDDMPWCEDMSMWAAITETHSGVHIGEVVYRLRQHADRATYSPVREEVVRSSHRDVVSRIARLRANAAAPGAVLPEDGTEDRS